jgi:hypothetical protein
MLFPELADNRNADYGKALFRIVDEINHLDAPPRYARRCGVAEAETVACMAKAYYGNKKPIGKDIAEKRADLSGFGEIADHILQYMPVEPTDEMVRI